MSTYYRNDAQGIEGNRRLIFSFGLERGSVFTINYPANAFLHLSGRKGSQVEEDEPDLGISYEVLPAGAGELPEVRRSVSP